MSLKTSQCEGGGLNPPADLSLYNLRAALTEKQNAETNEFKKEQLNLLVQQVDRLNKPMGLIGDIERADLMRLMWRQSELIRRTSAP